MSHDLQVYDKKSCIFDRSISYDYRKVFNTFDYDLYEAVYCPKPRRKNVYIDAVQRGIDWFSKQENNHLLNDVDSFIKISIGGVIQEQKKWDRVPYVIEFLQEYLDALKQKNAKPDWC